MKEETFHEKLKRLIHEYIMLSYKHTKKYPSGEKFGLTSQDRRAAVSIMLNYVEGYARMKTGVMVYQFETSYGSLKESIYCRFLAKELKYITTTDYLEALALKEKIGGMLCGTIEGIKKRR
jgi:four helix bundle protein